MTPSQQKVMPCPFGCESKPYAAIFNDGTHIAIFCPVCGTEGPIHDTEPKALAAWNTRPRPTSPAAERVGDVKRWYPDGDGVMFHAYDKDCPPADWVSYDDYAKLEAELAKVPEAYCDQRQYIAMEKSALGYKADAIRIEKQLNAAQAELATLRRSQGVTRWQAEERAHLEDELLRAENSLAIEADFEPGSHAAMFRLSTTIKALKLALAALEPRQGTDARVREALLDYGATCSTEMLGSIQDGKPYQAPDVEHFLQALLADGHGGGRG